MKLERIAPQADGFTAVVSGAGWAKLCQLAGAGGWQVIQMQRRGPGPLAERLLRRPGILAGIGLFFVLLRWLSGFLWCMNLELLTVPQQESIRTLLAQSGIWEGCRPSQAELAQAQQLLEASGDFGWVSLNFAGGCLTAEGTPPPAGTCGTTRPEHRALCPCRRRGAGRKHFQRFCTGAAGPIRWQRHAAGRCGKSWTAAVRPCPSPPAAP